MVKKTDHANHTSAGAPDRMITARTGDDTIVGGPGNDTIRGGGGRNLLVGDNFRPGGDALGHAGHDEVTGSHGPEVLIGDNLASGRARGAGPDDVEGKAGSDTLIGDSAVTRCGSATGGADDTVNGAGGDDLILGDSFSQCGTATGNGDDDLNHAIGSAIEVGDSATVTGAAHGGGNDSLHGMTGGDNHRRCDTCDQHLYGDSFALTTKGTHPGTGNDLLTASLGGKAYLDGIRSNPGGGGRGKTLCAGNKFGDNSAINCAVYKDIQHVLKHAQPPPPLKQFGAPWPGRTTSPRP